VLKETRAATISSTIKDSAKNAKETRAPPEDGDDGNTKPHRHGKKKISR